MVIQKVKLSSQPVFPTFLSLFASKNFRSCVLTCVRSGLHIEQQLQVLAGVHVERLGAAGHQRHGRHGRRGGGNGLGEGGEDVLAAQALSHARPVGGRGGEGVGRGRLEALGGGEALGRGRRGLPGAEDGLLGGRGVRPGGRGREDLLVVVGDRLLSRLGLGRGGGGVV